jgi:hypothetical protein
VLPGLESAGASQRGAARRLIVTIQPFHALSARERSAASEQADALGEPAGLTVDTQFAS